MGIKLKELEDYFSTTEFDDKPFTLDQCTVIGNKRTFMDSHLRALRANSGNKTMLPYFDRLKKFYLMIKTDKK